MPVQQKAEPGEGVGGGGFDVDDAEVHAAEGVLFVSVDALDQLDFTGQGPVFCEDLVIHPDQHSGPELDKIPRVMGDAAGNELVQHRPFLVLQDLVDAADMDISAQQDHLLKGVLGLMLVQDL